MQNNNSREKGLIDFKEFWRNKTKGLSRSKKKALYQRYFNHYQWGAGHFCAKNPFMYKRP